jgi:hypothetical protein
MIPISWWCIGWDYGAASTWYSFTGMREEKQTSSFLSVVLTLKYRTLAAASQGTPSIL